jgi:DNA polymerase
VESFDGISITQTATNTVFADGQADAQIMLIGEAPGAEEDAQAIPFCGASGQMLDSMLAYIGLSRKKNIYITNTLFWRPPGNRRPTAEELAICLPFVEKHIALIKPKIIILVGSTAVAALIDSKKAITQLRGHYFDYQNEYIDSPIKTTAIFHPSYLLRSPGQKQHAWQDCLKIHQYLKDNNIQM